MVGEHASPATADHAIRLLVRTELPVSRHYDMFTHSYVLDCIAADTILPNLRDYRVTLHTVASPYGPHDPLQVTRLASCHLHATRYCWVT